MVRIPENTKIGRYTVHRFIKEKANKYRLAPPNGMLLYGPPGCGKTFFAQKFAEETGFNYYLVNGSDLGSTYVHGTQGKIAELTDKYASSDIAFIVNEAAMVAALSDSDITDKILTESIRCNKSSLPPKEQRTKIGF